MPSERLERFSNLSLTSLSTSAQNKEEKNEAEKEVEEKRAELERREGELKKGQSNVEDAISKTKEEFGALKENLQVSASKIDNAFWWLDLTAWVVPITTLLLYFGAFFYLGLPVDPFGYAGVTIVVSAALFLRLLIWQVRFQASGEDVSFVQSIKESVHALPLHRFKLGFRPTKLDSKLSDVWTNVSGFSTAVTTRYVPGLRDYFETQDIVRNVKGFVITLRNSLSEYGMRSNESAERYFSRFRRASGDPTEWIRKAAKELAPIYGTQASVIQFIYADYIGDDQGKKDNWKAITESKAALKSLVSILLDSEKLPGDYHAGESDTYGGIEELVLKTTPFSISSFLDSYTIQYYEFAAEKDSLLDAVRAYHIKTSPAIEAKIKSLVPPTFQREQRLNALFAKASPLVNTDATILRLIFYEREAISDKRTKVWLAMTRSESESLPTAELANGLSGLSKRRLTIRHFVTILEEGGLVEIPMEYTGLNTVEFVVKAVSYLNDYSLSAVRSQVHQAFNSIQTEMDSLIRTISANSIQIGEGERAKFTQILPVSNPLNVLIEQLSIDTRVSDYVILLLYYDFTAQHRKRDDHFIDNIRDQPKRLNSLAKELLSRRLVSSAPRTDSEEKETLSNLTTYMTTLNTFSKTDIDSVYSNYGRLFEYTKGVFRFMVNERICAESNELSFKTILELVPHPERDFFDNVVKVVTEQIKKSAESKLSADWLLPVAFATTTAFLVTKEDMFLANTACRHTSNNSKAVSILYTFSVKNDEEQYRPQLDKTPFAEIVKQTITETTPRRDYFPEFQRALNGGFLYWKISDIPATRLRDIHDQLTRVTSELDFKKKLDSHLQALATFLRSELKGGIVMESLRMQLVIAYAITLPTSAKVIGGVLEERLPAVCDEIAGTDPSFKDLFTKMEATQHPLGVYTRLGVVPFRMPFSDFSEKLKRAYQIAVQRYSDTGDMTKPMEEYIANVIRIFPTDAYFKQLEPFSPSQTKNPEDYLSDLIRPVMLSKFGEIRTAEILASLNTEEEGQVAMRAILTTLYDTKGALYLISRERYDNGIESPAIREHVTNGSFESNLAESFGKKTLSSLALTIYNLAKTSDEDKESTRLKLRGKIESIRTLTRPHAPQKGIDEISRITFENLYDIGMILSYF